MKIIFCDFETYYDSKTYTLRTMTPVEYVLDPRFEAIGCAIKEGLDGVPYWIDGPCLDAFFQGLADRRAAGEKICVVGHNMLFDGCILAWRYGFIPDLLSCTMAIAKAMLRYLLKSVSLKSVAMHLGLGAKGDTVVKVDGMTLAAIKFAGLYPQYIAYSLQDVELCAGIWRKLVVEGGFPVGELAVLDMVLRTTIEPEFTLDRTLLAEHLQEVLVEKETLLAKVMLSSNAGGKSDLMSNEKFAELLRQLGVEPPMKKSPSTGLPAYAFAKTDVAFMELAEHENPAVQTLVEARLGHKTTLEESRTQRFIKIANLQWPNGQQCLMPMPIGYGAAHTHRLGGDWKLNVQNLKRGGKLRRALKVSSDRVVVPVDAAQIEAREVAYFCGCNELITKFANKEDVYASFATIVFGFPVDKKYNPDERFVGKQGILGLGYGLGWLKFQARLKTDSLNQTGKMISLDDEEAMKVVTTYRDRYWQIPKTWKRLNYEGIPSLANGGGFEFGPCKFEHQAILLPNGLRLRYHDLQQVDGEWRFTFAGKKERLYGGKLLENLMQALARIHTLDAALRIQKRSKQQFGVAYRLKQQAHDENVFLPRREHAEDLRVICLEEMRRRPWWAPDLPLDAEAGMGPSYGDAK